MSPLTAEQAAEHRAALAASNGHLVNPLRVYSAEELRNLPPVRWLIDKVLVGAFAVLYGASSVGKTFLALGWALTVASGRPWINGAATLDGGGWVLYICAEGSGGLLKRLDAWSSEHEAPIPERIRFVTEAVCLDDPPTLAAAVAAVKAMPELPVLIVIDTLARCMLGNENATPDMNAFIRAVGTLCGAAGGAAALVVHHTGKKGDDERGAYALRGAADQMILLSSNGRSMRLESNKTKDFEDPPPLSLHLAPAGELGDSTTVRFGGSDGGPMTANERRVLERLSELDGSDRPSVTRLAAICEMTERTYHRALAGLRKRGYIKPEYEGRAVFNSLTDTGREALK